MFRLFVVVVYFCFYRFAFLEEDLVVSLNVFTTDR